MPQKPPGTREDGSMMSESLPPWGGRGETAARFRGAGGYIYGEAEGNDQRFGMERQSPAIPTLNQWNLPSHLPSRTLQSSFFNPTPQSHPTPTSAITPTFANHASLTPRHAHSHSYPTPTQHPLNHLGSAHYGVNGSIQAQPYPQPTYPPLANRYAQPSTSERTFQYPQSTTMFGNLQPSYMNQNTIQNTQQYRNSNYQFQSPSSSSTPLASSFHQHQHQYAPSNISIPSTSAPSSALPSPAYTQSPIYPFTPLAQSFSQLPTHSGWERPLTIPTSVFAPPSVHRGGGWEDDRDRKGSYNSVESTDDGVEAGYGKVLGEAEKGVESPAEYSQNGVQRGQEEEEDEEVVSEVSAEDTREVEEESAGRQVVVYTTSAEIRQTQWLKRKCYNCGDSEAPSWRRSIQYEGSILCNKCGIYERTNKRDRPLSVTAGVHTHPRPRSNSKATKTTATGKGYRSRKPTPLKISTSPRKVGNTRRSGPPSSLPTSQSGSEAQIPTPNSSNFSQSILTPFNIANDHRGVQTPLTAVSASLPPSATLSTFPSQSSGSSMNPPTSFPSDNGVYHNHNTRGRSVSTSTPNSSTISSSTSINRRSVGYGPYPTTRRSTHAYTGALRGSSTLGGGGLGRTGLKPSYIYTDDDPLSLPGTGQLSTPISSASDGIGGVGVEMSRDGSGSTSSDFSCIPTPREEQVGFGNNRNNNGIKVEGLGLGVGLEIGAGLGEEGRGMKRDEEYVVSWMIGRRGS